MKKLALMFLLFPLAGWGAGGTGAAVSDSRPADVEGEFRVEAVDTNDLGHLALNSDTVLRGMLTAIKELQMTIEEYRVLMEQQRAEIDSLRDAIDELRSRSR